MNIGNKLVLMVAIAIVSCAHAATTDLGVRARKPVLVQKEAKPKAAFKFLCADPACNYGSHNATHFKDHMRKHTGERPFKCYFCNYRATQRSNLKKHMLSCRKGEEASIATTVTVTPSSSSSDLVESPAAEKVPAERSASRKKHKRELHVVIPDDDMPRNVIMPIDLLEAVRRIGKAEKVTIVKDDDCGDGIIVVD